MAFCESPHFSSPQKSVVLHSFRSRVDPPSSGLQTPMASSLSDLFLQCKSNSVLRSDIRLFI